MAKKAKKAKKAKAKSAGEIADLWIRTDEETSFFRRTGFRQSEPCRKRRPDRLA